MKLAIVSKTAFAAGVLGIAFALPAGAAAPSGPPANDAPMPGTGKSTYSTMPDKAVPRTDNEVGPQTPPEHSKVIPPAGSARAPNPESPKSTNEASDAHPERIRGGTSGSSGVGVKRRSDDGMMNR